MSFEDNLNGLEENPTAQGVMLQIEKTEALKKTTLLRMLRIVRRDRMAPDVTRQSMNEGVSRH
jgi:hypothetical protein